jgi:hypothetical protein
MNYLTDLISAKLGNAGRLISGSKGRYLFNNPTHVVFFNANIYTSNKEKVWYGDIDISTQDLEMLKEAAMESGQFLLILSESEGRFGREFSPDLSKALCAIGPSIRHSGGIQLSSSLQLSTIFENGRPFLKQDDMEAVEPEYPTVNLSSWTDIDISALLLEKKYTIQHSPIDELTKVVHRQVDKNKMKAVVWSTDTDKAFNKILDIYARKTLKMDDEYEIHKALSWASLDLPSKIKNGDFMHVYVKISNN